MSEAVNTHTGEIVQQPTPGDLPRLLPHARRALDNAVSVAEISHLADYGQVCRVAATRAKLGKESRDDWGEFVIDAERKAGQVLKRMRENGQRANSGQETTRYRHNHTISDLPTLVDLGVAKEATKARNRANRWQSIAELDDDEYAEMKAKIRANTEQFINEAVFIARGKHLRREQEKRDRAAADAASVPTRPTIATGSWETWLPNQPACDLLLTDPPYSTDIEDVDQFAAEWLPVALGIVKLTGRAYVCIGAYPDELRAYLNVDPPAGLELANVLVWTYRNTLGPKPTHDYKLNWQAILYYRGQDAPPLDCPEMVEQFSVQDINAPDGRRGDRWHAWQKPDLLAERLVRHSTQPGDLVLDPFAGTGTFILAAARLGREAVGCEKDVETIAIAEERGCERA